MIGRILTLWSNSFLRFQLFTNLKDKETIYKNYIFSYHLYTYINEGKVTWNEWNKFSPKTCELFQDVIKELREIKLKAKEQALAGQN